MRFPAVAGGSASTATRAVPSPRLPVALLRRPFVALAAVRARHWLLAGCLLAAAAAAWLASTPPPAGTRGEIIASTARPLTRTAARAERPAPASTASRSRVAASDAAAALFGAHSWYVPPPPPPPGPPERAPEPTAPPFPYGVMGSYAPQGEKAVYFLTRGDRVFEARVGDRIDATYDLEKAGDGQLVFNYLPLNIRQSVAMGSAP